MRSEYTGFTKEEVKELCEKYGLSYEEAKSWYDGYEFSGIGAIHNPYSIMCAIRSKLTRIALKMILRLSKAGMTC